MSVRIERISLLAMLMMLRVVAVLAQRFEIIPRQCNGCRSDIFRCQIFFVVNGVTMPRRRQRSHSPLMLSKYAARVASHAAEL